jgi:hypothetical protein
VVAEIRNYRIDILAGALKRRQDDRATESRRAPVRLAPPIEQLDSA